MKNQSFSGTRKVLLAFLLFSTSNVFAQKDSLTNAVSISYDHTSFDRQFEEDWKLTSLQYSHKTGLGTVIGRVNQANRFARSGWQIEGEAYPTISKKLYAYTGFSYSNDVPVFAQWRTGTTLYYNFAKGWEAEGGFRYLYFNHAIWIGTAGVSTYLGAWLLNARTFFSVDAPFDSRSFFLKAQRYLKNENDYLWLQVGSGVSPDESRSIQLNSAAQLFSKRVNAGARFSLSRQLQVNLSAAYARDEYRAKTFGNQYTGSAGLSFRF